MLDAVLFFFVFFKDSRYGMSPKYKRTMLSTVCRLSLVGGGGGGGGPSGLEAEIHGRVL